MRIGSEVNQVTATCTREQAEILAAWDHHRVRVGERWGILITYPLMMQLEAAAGVLAAEVPAEPLEVKVVFNPAPKHMPTAEQARAIVFKHPPAPQAVQEIIDRLSFEAAKGS